MLEVISLTKQFTQGDGSTIVLFDKANASFNKGKTYAITGVSGTGKSTLLYMLAGLEKPTDGKIMYQGHNIAHVTRQQSELFLQHDVGIIFQQPYLIGELSVLDNVTLKGRICGNTNSQLHERGLELLETVGLAHKAYQTPAVLSGGEQQRVALARALYGKPALLLADEPTAHLDEENKITITELLISIRTLYSSCLIISTHDLSIARSMDIRYNIHNAHLDMV